jgi:hypothetical protein
MKILGLTLGRLFAALIFGLLIAFTITYITVPHSVDVPVQVITPVPTPPPVVITEHPAEVVHPSATMSESWNKTISDINQSTFAAFNIAAIALVVIALVGIIAMISGVFRRGDF